ncbi:hypothetical protein F2Q68_00010066 [Brassica cretica]|uniref:Uncharacterized protein n=1 Tax=Brassica cretica TaxID=69181 RepID=A0A8S9KXL8_BRACR|nr:hypothetical protein F2Q68_00010066 [Brassica cretica]
MKSSRKSSGLPGSLLTKPPFHNRSEHFDLEDFWDDLLVFNQMVLIFHSFKGFSDLEDFWDDLPVSRLKYNALDDLPVSRLDFLELLTKSSSISSGVQACLCRGMIYNSFVCVAEQVVDAVCIRECTRRHAECWRPCGCKMPSWSEINLRTSLDRGKRKEDKLGEQVYRKGENHLRVFFGHAEANAEVSTMERQVWNTIMLDDGRWSLEGANETVDSRNQGAWTAVETVWEEPYIVTTEEKKLKPKEPGQGIVREYALKHEKSGNVLVQKVHISWGRRTFRDGRPDVDIAYLVGEKHIYSLIQKACRVLGTMWMQDVELEKDKLRFMS